MILCEMKNKFGVEIVFRLCYLLILFKLFKCAICMKRSLVNREISGIDKYIRGENMREVKGNYGNDK